MSGYADCELNDDEIYNSKKEKYAGFQKNIYFTQYYSEYV